MIGPCDCERVLEIRNMLVGRDTGDSWLENIRINLLVWILNYSPLSLYLLFSLVKQKAMVNNVVIWKLLKRNH